MAFGAPRLAAQVPVVRTPAASAPDSTADLVATADGLVQ